VEHWCRRRPKGEDVLAEFHALSSEPEAA
jgi:hypothetical protein